MLFQDDSTQHGTQGVQRRAQGGGGGLARCAGNTCRGKACTAAKRCAADAADHPLLAHGHGDERGIVPCGLGCLGGGFQQAGGIRRGVGHYGQLGDICPTADHISQGVDHRFGGRSLDKVMAAEHGFYAAFPRLLLDGSNDRRSRADFDIQQIRQATVADSSAEFAVCGIGEIGQTALFFGSDGGQ